MNTSLSVLKNFSMVGVKTSFEDEGAHPFNVYKLRNVTNKLCIDLNLKIGGAEAKTDFNMGIDMGCDSIVAPMIESPFALSKFIAYSKDYDITRGINIESKQGIQNLESILDSKYIEHLDYICIGRSDLAASYEANVLSDEFCDLVSNTLMMIKDREIKTCMGGMFDARSHDFVKHLHDNGLIDKVETRYIIFKTDKNFVNNFEESITHALEFEYEYMKMLYEGKVDKMNEYSDRYEIIKKRLGEQIDVV